MDLPNEIQKQGLIVKVQSGFLTVDTGEGFVICRLRGKLKQGRTTGDIAALGDRVEITVLSDGSGVVENVRGAQAGHRQVGPASTGTLSTSPVGKCRPGSVSLRVRESKSKVENARPFPGYH
jgi:hypothetical protein